MAQVSGMSNESCKTSLSKRTTEKSGVGTKVGVEGAGVAVGTAVGSITSWVAGGVAVSVGGIEVAVEVGVRVGVLVGVGVDVGRSPTLGPAPTFGVGPAHPSRPAINVRYKTEAINLFIKQVDLGRLGAVQSSSKSILDESRIAHNQDCLC